MRLFRCRSLSLVVVIAAACGGSPPREATTSSEGEAASAPADCEKGRCLEDIRAVVAEHRAEARACYDAGLKRQPDMQGRLIINFEIDPTGAVTDASQGMQDEQISDPEVVACVSEVIKSIKFAASAQNKTTRAYHRFEFSPRGT